MLKCFDLIAAAGRSNHDCDVVQHFAIARHHFGGANPGVGRKTGIHLDRDVIDDSRGRHRDRLGHLHDPVRPANGPSVGKLAGRRQVGRIALGQARVDPVVKQLLLIRRQAPLVGEAANCRIRMPRRHGALADALAHRVGPGHGVVVAGQREGTNLPRAMTFDAVLGQNRRDVSTVRHRARAGRFGSVDEAAGNLRFADRDGFARQQFFDRLDQIVAERLGPALARIVLVIDAAVITNLSVAIEQEYFKLPGGAKPIGSTPSGVDQDRKPAAEVLSELGHVGRAVVGVRIDSHHGHAGRLEARGNLVEPGSIESCQRALSADKGDHDQPVLAKVVQPVHRPAVVRQFEIHRRARGQRRACDQQQ